MDGSLKQLKIKDNKIEQLGEMGIFNIEDLLFNLPRRYVIIEETELLDGEVVTIEGELLQRPKTVYSRVQVMNLEISYHDMPVKVVIFNRNFLISKMESGMKLTVVGKYEKRLNKITASNIYLSPLDEISSITPVYNLVEGMAKRSYNSYLKKAFNLGGELLEEDLPEQLIIKRSLIKKRLALQLIHYPTTKEDILKASEYFKYREFFKFQLAIQYVKYLQSKVVGKTKDFNQDLVDDFIAKLEFALTKDQVTACLEILEDLKSRKQMYRFLQGDVGTGKTVVAAIGFYANFLSGYQGALMVPTEILAQQHYKTFTGLFEATGVRIEMLTGSTKNKTEIYKRLEKGEIDLVIGTHALFQAKVNFANLGMVVADEQHRFGVNQRKALKEKGELVDFMVMSATPIPRTLAMTVYGDMDISTIKTKPLHRKQVHTKVVEGDSMKPILRELVDYLATGGQVYVVCPLVNENETMDTRDAINIHQGMAKYFKGKYEVGLVHGKLKDSQKHEMMMKFENNEIQILVATTVIEEGVNVANANMMVIYNADRFGLSQLHQLRGRIGRGNQEGYCYLLTKNQTPLGRERLDFIAECNDGFEIANRDLLYRGPGELLGNRQSGITRFEFGDVTSDYDILAMARDDAIELLNGKSNDPRYLKILNKIEEESQNNNLYID